MFLGDGLGHGPQVELQTADLLPLRPDVTVRARIKTIAQALVATQEVLSLPSSSSSSSVVFSSHGILKCWKFNPTLSLLLLFPLLSNSHTATWFTQSIRIRSQELRTGTHKRSVGTERRCRRSCSCSVSVSASEILISSTSKPERGPRGPSGRDACPTPQQNKKQKLFSSEGDLIANLPPTGSFSHPPVSVSGLGPSNTATAAFS